ncbi:MAG: dehydrogenase [Herpetosiphonaceae bacterium]|nr:MAG: dehydrogenase [Herpetosiphonaceae bacterium]
MDASVNIGLIGCGKISSQYLESCSRFPILRIGACADLDERRAAEKAAEFGVPRACPVADLLQDPEIDLVVNLTVPKVHAEVSLAAIEAGKHVYSEKPLAITEEDARRILAAAAAHGVRVGCAPATHLGGGYQMVRRLIDSGAIGIPVAATAFMMNRGPESWHPNPSFYYQVGGGPLLDMGPYYITALVSLLGPVRRVTGLTRASFPERIATSAELYGLRIPVEVATHAVGLLEFSSGVIATLITSFDIWAHSLPRIEIYGSEGSITAPDPNIFGGPVRLYRSAEMTWQEVPLSHSPNVGRGIGVADLAAAVLGQQPCRIGGDLAYHVLEIMLAIEEAARTERHILLRSTCERPAPLPPGVPEAQLNV